MYSGIKLIRPPEGPAKVSVKQGLRINVTDTYFVNTKTKT